MRRTGLDNEARELLLFDGKSSFSSAQVNVYFASVAADFLRRKLLEVRASFTFETIMSSPDKGDFPGKALSLGYRNHPHYVATQDPAINISRDLHLPHRPRLPLPQLSKGTTTASITTVRRLTTAPTPEPATAVAPFATNASTSNFPTARAASSISTPKKARNRLFRTSAKRR